MESGTCVCVWGGAFMEETRRGRPGIGAGPGAPQTDSVLSPPRKENSTSAGTFKPPLAVQPHNKGFDLHFILVFFQY